MQHTVMNTVSELLIVRVVETNWDEKDLAVRSMSGQLELMKPGMKIRIRL